MGRKTELLGLFLEGLYFEDLNSSYQEVDPRYQDRATGTLPLFTQPFSFALLEQKKSDRQGPPTVRSHLITPNALHSHRQSP